MTDYIALARECGAITLRDEGCLLSASQLAVFAARIAALSVAPSQDRKDAYEGAREDLLIWKRRALEAEELVRKFMREVNGPVFMGEPVMQAAAGAPSQDREDAQEALIRKLTVQSDEFVESGMLDTAALLTEAARAIAAALSVAPSQDCATVAEDTARLDWLLPNLAPANFGMGFEWEDDAEFLRKWRAAIDEEIKEAARRALSAQQEGGKP